MPRATVCSEMNCSIFEVRVALGIGQLRNAHVVAGYRHQERIREQEVCVGDLPDEVVADAKRQVEAIEPVRRKHRQILRPHLAIVVPGLVFHVAREETGPTANAIVWLLDQGFCWKERRSILRAICQVEEGEHKPTSIVSDRQKRPASRHESERFGRVGNRYAGALQQVLCSGRARSGGNDALIALFGFGKITAHLNGPARGLQRPFELLSGPLCRSGVGHGIRGIHNK